MSERIKLVAGTRKLKRALPRRPAVEPVIGHLKDGDRMERNYLAGHRGDAANRILVAVGYKFRLLFAWIAALLYALMAACLNSADPHTVKGNLWRKNASSHNT